MNQRMTSYPKNSDFQGKILTSMLKYVIFTNGTGSMCVNVTIGGECPQQFVM